MKILVDENIPLMTVRALRETGHDVLDIRSTEKKSMADDILWKMVQQRKEIVYYDRQGIYPAP